MDTRQIVDKKGGGGGKKGNRIMENFINSKN